MSDTFTSNTSPTTKPNYWYLAAIILYLLPMLALGSILAIDLFYSITTGWYSRVFNVALYLLSILGSGTILFLGLRYPALRLRAPWQFGLVALLVITGLSLSFLFYIEASGGGEYAWSEALGYPYSWQTRTILFDSYVPSAIAKAAMTQHPEQVSTDFSWQRLVASAFFYSNWGIIITTGIMWLRRKSQSE